MDDQKLMDYFKFDEADLQANRFGKLSEKQTKNFTKTQTNDRKFYFRFGWVLTVMALGTVVLFLLITGFNFSLSAAHLVQAVLFGVFFLLFLWGAITAFSTGFKNTVDVSNDKVKEVEGPINIVKTESSGAHNRTIVMHELHIKGKEFYVDEDAANIVMQGDTYIIYHYEDGPIDKILSLELVSKAK
ncbi:MAG TPA: hypothetical protein VMT73_11520 [Anaerolineales bacterium]|nr:hypothetical protein [Anaerolineales bacterium]